MANEEKNAIIVIILIALSLFLFFNFDFFKPEAGATITLQEKDLTFAGYDWDITVEGHLYECAEDPDRHSGSCSGGGGSYEVTSEGFIELEGYASSGVYCDHGCKCKPPSDSLVCMTTIEDITDIDEFLIIWSGYTQDSSFRIGLLDKSTGTKKTIKSAEFVNHELKPTLVKIVNDFDGTYSIYSALGVGDLFIKDGDIDVRDFDSRHLQVCVSSSAGCTWGEGGESSSGTVRIYNIVTKRLESPLCKADEILNAQGECEPFDTFLLAHESAIYESLEEKIDRISKRLEARQEGLQNRILDLEEFLSISTKDAKLAWIEDKLVELEQLKVLAENSHKTEIGNLEEAIREVEIDIEQREESARREILKDSLEGLQEELEYLKSLDPSREIRDQISFYEAQRKLLDTSLGEDMLSELEEELELTKQILEGLKNNDIVPPADVDIEDVISDILAKIELEEAVSGTKLSEAEIQNLISEEVNSQFQERNPSGLVDKTEKFPIIPAIIVIGIILLVILLTDKRR